MPRTPDRRPRLCPSGRARQRPHIANVEDGSACLESFARFCVSVNLSCIQVTEYHAARFLVNRFFFAPAGAGPPARTRIAHAAAAAAHALPWNIHEWREARKEADWIGVFRRSSAGLRPTPTCHSTRRPRSPIESRYPVSRSASVKRVATRTGVMCESIRDVARSPARSNFPAPDLLGA